MTGARYLSPPLSPFSSLLSVFSPTHLLALPQLSSQLLPFGLLSEPFSLLSLFFSREPQIRLLLQIFAQIPPSQGGGTLSPPPSAPLTPITLPYLFPTSTCYLSTYHIVYFFTSYFFTSYFSLLQLASPIGMYIPHGQRSSFIHWLYWLAISVTAHEVFNTSAN